MTRRKSSKVSMYDYQVEALGKMSNGCILNGGVGTGKSRTSLAYYYTQYGGKINTKDYVKMKNPPDLYIITTARKRDDGDWVGELLVFNMHIKKEFSIYKNHNVVIDSWNNIKKYRDVKNAFFIFDEQRVVGSGTWVKSFLRISRHNKWILLSATPGDTWSDYIPVFLANRFYKNRTQFNDEHVVYSRFTKFPCIDRYVNTKKLEFYRQQILVDMQLKRTTIRHYKDIMVDYDMVKYKKATKDRWDPYLEQPIENPATLCYIQRRIVNENKERSETLLKITKKHDRVIVFYNFDYELNILRSIPYDKDVVVAEWNGHKHELVPDAKRWVYLVQYTAGAEGWNCITTNCTVFYSQNYSYKIMEQASGRVDRVNTKYIDLYYYTFKSRASIDVAVARAIRDKKKFNERGYSGWK